MTEGTRHHLANTYFYIGYNRTVAQNTLIIILMGVSGSGKTTVGRLLAVELGWMFYDGDDFHPEANIEKMKKGIALTDKDRKPWLDPLQNLILDLVRNNQSAVIACSALKKSYRDILAKGKENVVFVYLKGNYDLLHRRLLERKGHFFDARLLESQFEILEEPEGVLTIDIAQEPVKIVSQVRRGLGL
jgi:gluconokinase